MDKELMASMQRQTKADPINPSGFRPTEFQVLVLPDEAEETITHGSLTLIKHSADIEKEKYAAQGGRLIAVSPLAFTYEHWPEGAVPPQVGEKVVFAKYSGVRRKSKKDGREYLLMKDKDLLCTEDE